MAQSFLKQYGSKLIEQGYEIVPIKRGYKYPRGLKKWQEQPSTQKALDGWLKNGFADGGVGIKCGTVVGVDLDILDVDMCARVSDCVNLISPGGLFRMGMPPKMMMVFRADEPFAKIVSKTYLDEWGDEHRVEILGGGQQFVSHAIHPGTGKPYTWIGDDLADRAFEDLSVLTEKHARRIVEFFEDNVPGDWVVKTKGSEGKAQDPNVPTEDRALMNVAPKVDISDEEIERHLSRIEDRSDDYHDWVRVGMALYYEFDGGTEGLHSWLTWSTNSDKFDAQGCVDKWPTFKANLSNTRPVTFASVIAMSQEARKERLEKSKPKATKFKLLHASDVLAKLGPINWRIEGFLEQNTTGMMFGDPGSFKSFLALDMGFHVAASMDWHGHKVDGGPVIYIAGEGHGGLARRFAAWQRAKGVDLSEIPFYVSERAAALYDMASAKEVVEAVEAVVKVAGRPAMVIVDTLARNFGGGDENSNTDMGVFINHVDNLLRARFEATVVVVHHTGQTNKTRARGASALKGGMDFEYRVDKHEDHGSVVSLTCTKMKDAVEPGTMWFESREIVIGDMESDEDMTSLVFGKCEAPVATEEIGVALKGLQLALYEVVETEGPVERDTLREICISAGVADHRKQFDSTLRKLMQKECIQEIDNKVSVLDGF